MMHIARNGSMTAIVKPRRILHLTLKRKWFDLIASGEKTIEYREIKPYWEKRFFGPDGPIQFDEVHFRNGYAKNAPFMRVVWDGLYQAEESPLGPDPVYAIHLGQILEVRR